MTTLDDRQVRVTDMQPTAQEIAAGVVEVTEIVRGRAVMYIIETDKRTITIGTRVDGVGSLGASVQSMAVARMNALDRLTNLRAKRKAEAEGREALAAVAAK